MKHLCARGKIVLSDYREYMNFQLFRGRFSRYLRALILLALLVAALYLLLGGIYFQATIAIVLGGTTLLCVVMFVFLLRKYVKDYCVKKKPFLYATHEVQCGGNGLIYTVCYDPKQNPQHLPDSKQTYLYADFFRVYETGGFFYFYPSKKSAVILPKRNMTPADSIALRGILQKEIGKRFIRCL